MSARDVHVQATGVDAIVSKFSAEQKGYFKDPFLKYFISGPVAKRAPLINRGYYTRFKAIDIVVERFLRYKASSKHQIVVLGAGVDTLFFRLAAAGYCQDNKLTVYDVDFETVTSIKVKTVMENKELFDLLHAQKNEKPDPATQSALHTSAYHIIPADLRNLELLRDSLKKCDIDFSAPTLLLSECVLVYVETACADAIINWAGSSFTDSIFMTYEQILPNTAFGRVMVNNIRNRGCPLQSVHEYPNLASLISRYKSLGWNFVQALDMNQVYCEFLPPKDVERVQRLELFDELEEWHLIQGHYSITIAINDPVAEDAEDKSVLVKTIGFKSKGASLPAWFNKYATS
jgi:O-methyltransferase involved in polyketide biosynthesis